MPAGGHRQRSGLSPVLCRRGPQTARRDVAMTLDAIRRLLAARGVASKVYAIFALLVAFNVAAWALAFVAFAKHPILLGTALLAYTFGLRHAVDADHISAIDNVTRKLMQDRRQPVTVGFYFSLGHSSVVVALS